MAAAIATTVTATALQVSLTHGLDRTLYDLPLTLRTELPDGWNRVRIAQAGTTTVGRRETATPTVVYQARPNGGTITLTRAD